jgi:hypothetical protein
MPRRSRRCRSRTTRRCAIDGDGSGFKRHQELALELEGRFPERFIRRYSMVMFHPEIPYAEALRRGAVQAEIIAAIDRDPARASALIHERLPPIGRGARL